MAQKDISGLVDWVRKSQNVFRIFSVRPSLFVAINSNIAEDSPLFPRLAEQAWAIPDKIGSIEIGREEGRGGERGYKLH